ncbi:ABC transporter ATP-binding protein [Staphylospora marina]|uniref:ABC transporter ATP-binding protein n=1 Tax=Staphylospora marina TaxID=2490858 RepID=UPI000F5BAC73|nr:ABC transporter ATP-binding protein [Staphylospora marina]
MNVLEARKLTKIYGQHSKGAVHKALDQLDLVVTQGEFVGIMGPSGSGKTTLLQLLGTIDRPTSGEIWINGHNVLEMNQKEIAHFRRRQLGFIFQDFHLLDALTIKENIILPLVLERKPLSEMEQRLNRLVDHLGIRSILSHRPYEVSGGQKQRAAAARAIIHSPALILADEPTGNLDSKSAKSLMEALVGLNQKERATIVMVTHDPVTASYCHRVIFIKDGKRLNEIRRGEDRRTFFQQIIHVMSALGGDSYEFAFSRP